MIPLLSAGVPWAPIMAWLIASPLNSPNTFLLVVGALGPGMAVAQVLAAVSLGIAAGLITERLEGAGFLRHQVRGLLPVAGGAGTPARGGETRTTESSIFIPLAPVSRPTSREAGRCAGACSTADSGPARVVASSPTGATSAWLSRQPPPLWRTRDGWRRFGKALVKGGTRRLLRNFALFLVVASAVRILVPTDWVIGLLGAQQLYSVPLAALMGIPLYTSNSSSVPLVQSLVEMGMGRGAAMALLIAGAGTSLPAMAGVLAVARARALALYLAFILGGAILFGYLYQTLPL